MQHEPFKNRKERLAELLVKNKIRLARNAAKEWYQNKLGYHLTAEQFLDFDASQRLLAEVYRKVRTLQKKKSLVATDFQNVLSILNDLKQKRKNLDEVSVIFYYLDTTKVGGIKIKFKEFWNLLEKIGSHPRTDIIVIDENLAFGICIEIEEYNYLLTVWGLDEEND